MTKQHLTEIKQTQWQKELVAESKKEQHQFWCILVQSGFPYDWWSDAVEYYGYLWNIEDSLAN